MDAITSRNTLAFVCLIVSIVMLLLCLAAQGATRDPMFSLPSGTLSRPTQVAISIPTEGVTYVTTDGTTPSGASPAYSKPLLVSWSQTIKAISIVNSVSSNVVTRSFVLDADKFPAPSAGGTTAPKINLQLPTTGQ